MRFIERTVASLGGDGIGRADEEQVILAEVSAWNSVGDECARRCSVAKERTGFERLVPRCVVHVLAACRERHAQGEHCDGAQSL